MRRHIFIAAAALGALAACKGPTASPAPSRSKRPQLVNKKLYRESLQLTTGVDIGSITPSIDFSITKAKVTDAGFARKPVYFRYDESTGAIAETGGANIKAEIAALTPATTLTEKNIRVSITPLWFQPSRDRFFHAGDWGHKKGAGKEYATLTISLSQREPLSELKDQPLSWSNAWSFITNHTQDVSQAQLSGDTTSAATFEEMPIVTGEATFGAEFITGTSNNNFQHTLNSILSPVTAVTQANGNPLNALGVPATAITTAMTYLNAIAQIVAALSNNAEIAYDMRNPNTRLIVDSAAYHPEDLAAVRLPQGNAIVFMVPEPDYAGFKKTLALMKQHNHRASINSGTALSVQDQQGNAVTSTPYAIDPNWVKIGPLDPFTIVIVQTYVTILPP